MNMIINGSILKNYRIIFSNDRKQLNNETRNLTFVNTYYSSCGFFRSKPFIQIINSNALFADTRIANVHTGNMSLINATLNSTVKLINCNISEITKSANFIFIFKFSVLEIVNCIFQKNTVDVFFQSQINSQNIVKGSIFSKNRGRNNETAVVFVALNNTKIHVFNSTFYANELQLISGDFYICINISHSKFISNNVKHTYLTKLFYHCCMVIENCDFSNNSGESIGISVLVDDQVSLNVRDSLYYNNTGGITAGFSLSNAVAYMQNDSFVRNSAIQGSCISVENQGKVHLRHCTFHGNVVGPPCLCLTRQRFIV